MPLVLLHITRSEAANIQTVASVLLHRGRLPLSQIIHFSGLRPRTVRAAILVLVQQNILWHAQSEPDGEVLEMNTDECLMRLRYGRYVWQAEQQFGKPVRYKYVLYDGRH